VRHQASFEYLLLVAGGLLAGLIVSSMMVSTTSSTATELNEQVHKYNVNINYATFQNEPPTIISFTVEPAVGKPQDTFKATCIAEDDIRIYYIDITGPGVSKKCGCSGASCKCELNIPPPKDGFRQGEYTLTCKVYDYDPSIICSNYSGEEYNKCITCFKDAACSVRRFSGTEARAKFVVTAVKALLELLWPPPDFVTGSDQVVVKWRLYDPDHIIDKIELRWDGGSETLSPDENTYTLSYANNACTYCRGTNTTIHQITVKAIDEDANTPDQREIVVRTGNIRLRDPPILVDANVLHASQRPQWDWRSSKKLMEGNVLTRWWLDAYSGGRRVDINVVIFDQDFYQGLTCSQTGNENVYLTVEWGDGSKSDYVYPSNLFNGGFYSAIVSHTYRADGWYTIKFSLKDDCNLTNYYYMKILVDTTGPEISYSFSPSQNVKGGGSVTVTCHFHDEGSGLHYVYITGQGQYKEANLCDWNTWCDIKDYSLSITVDVPEEEAVGVICGGNDVLSHPTTRTDYACADYHKCDYAGDRWCAGSTSYWLCETRTAGTCSWLVHRWYHCPYCGYICTICVRTCTDCYSCCCSYSCDKDGCTCTGHCTCCYSYCCGWSTGCYCSQSEICSNGYCYPPPSCNC